MNTNKPALVESTYQRDGQWYTMAVIDKSTAHERLATDDEIAAAKPAKAAEPKADHPANPPAKKVTKAKAKK